MDNGWIKLHRKAINSQVFQNDGLWKVWCWCLMKASHRDYWASTQTGRGMSEIKIKAGQFIFGRNASAKELRMKPSTVRNRMEKLKSIRNLDMQKNSHYTIVTITNWDVYQIDEKNEDTQEDRQRTGKGQAKDTYKNVKNIKKDLTTTTGTGKTIRSPAKKEDKISFDYETKRFLNVTDDLRTRWQEAYPAVDVLSELRRAEAWADANPKNRKSNWKRFLINWLTRAQDKAVRVANRNSGSVSEPPDIKFVN